jgi:hypothetical protein
MKTHKTLINKNLKDPKQTIINHLESGASEVLASGILETISFKKHGGFLTSYSVGSNSKRVDIEENDIDWILKGLKTDVEVKAHYPC